MPAPIPGFIQLPDDTANTGKKPRTQTRVVGANTVHEHYLIPISLRSKKVFHYSTPLQAVSATAQDAVATGFFWLQNPTASVIDLIVRKIVLRFGSVNTATVTLPRIVLAKFTFTGTASGATVTPLRRKTADANAADMRTAVTGMTVTLGAVGASFIVPQLLAAGQVYAPPEQVWPGAGHDPFEDDDIILAPGEGAVLYQADAGTTADPRRFTADVRAEEVER
jgi:hypothetical protein